MAIDGRIRELGTRHSTLERAIEDELGRPLSDSQKLQHLKRQKLKLKEQLETLRNARAH